MSSDRKVLVLTAGSGAGWGDFTSQLSRHMSSNIIEARWIRVQGEGLVEDLTHQLAQIEPADVALVIVMRGGGGWTDLQVFDDIRVARAIATAKVPVATAVGHAKDVSLSDLAATWAFITPSVAGEALDNSLWRQSRGQARPAAATPHVDTAARVSRADRLQALLDVERERNLSAHQLVATVQSQLWTRDRDHAQLWRFTDSVLLESAQHRIRSRSRWQTLHGALVIYASLVLASAGGVWMSAGASAATAALAWSVFAWKGPMRATRPASHKALRRAPRTSDEWVERTRAARTPRELRILASSRAH